MDGKAEDSASGAAEDFGTGDFGADSDYIARLQQEGVWDGAQEGRIAQLEAVVEAQAARIRDLERDLSRVQALLEPDRAVLRSFLTGGQLQHRIRNLAAWLQQAILAIQPWTGQIVPEP